MSRADVLFTSEEMARILALSPLPLLPPDPTNRVADDPAAAHFGRYLFFDRRLSGSGQVSCASCHDPARNWTDGQALPIRFSPELRHVPSLWNAAYNRWFSWDGRSDSLWAQALESLEHPTRYGGSRLEIVRLLYQDDRLRRAYEKIFGLLPDVPDEYRLSGVSVPGKSDTQPTAAAASTDPRRAGSESIDRIFVNLGKALAAYQRRIVSRRAPFDVFVEGLKTADPTRIGAISPEAQRGLKLFIGRGNCRACHHGANFTDGEFHNIGINALDARSAPDLGRFLGADLLLNSPFNATGIYSDDQSGRTLTPTAFLFNRAQFNGQFKTPSLRNVAVTPPYMHHGQLATLADVVQYYSTLRLPEKQASPSGLQGITRFYSSWRGSDQEDEQTQDASAPVMRRRRQANQATHTHGIGRRERILSPLNLSRSEMNELVAFLNSLTDTVMDPSLTTQPASPEYP